MNAIGLTGGNTAALELAAERILATITAGGYPVVVCLFYKPTVPSVSALRRNTMGFTEIWQIGPYTGQGRQLFDHGLVNAFIDDQAVAAIPARVDEQLRRFLHLIDQCRAVPAALQSHHQRISP